MVTGNSGSKTLNARGCQIYIDLNANLYFLTCEVTHNRNTCVRIWPWHEMAL